MRLHLLQLGVLVRQAPLLCLGAVAAHEAGVDQRCAEDGEDEAGARERANLHEEADDDCGPSEREGPEWGSVDVHASMVWQPTD